MSNSTSVVSLSAEQPAPSLQKAWVVLQPNYRIKNTIATIEDDLGLTSHFFHPTREDAGAALKHKVSEGFKFHAEYRARSLEFLMAMYEITEPWPESSYEIVCIQYSINKDTNGII